MQVLTGMIELNKYQEYRGFSFIPEGEETELLRRAILGDVEARLQLVKEYLNLVVEFAAGYAQKTGKPFPQMVQTGALAVTKAVDTFYQAQQIEFGEHVRREVIKAMEATSYF